MNYTRLYHTLVLLLLTSLAHAQVNIYSGSSEWSNNTCQGVIGVSAQGDAGPFDIRIDQLQADGTSFNYQNATIPLGESSPLILLLNTPGNYSVTVTDALGCVTTETLSIFCGCNMQLNIFPDAIEIVRPTTCDATDGALSYYHPSGPPVSNYVGPVTYIWSDGVSTPTMDRENLPAGPLTLTITDANGCEAEKDFVIKAADHPYINIVLKRPCEGLANGRIRVDVFNFQNQEDSFVFEWESPLGTFSATGNEYVIENAPSGTYNLTMTNSTTGCEYQEIIILEDLPTCGELLISDYMTSKSCPDDATGSISIVVEGGNPSLSPSVFPGICNQSGESLAGYSMEWSLAGSSDIISTSKHLMAVAAGTYAVTVTDQCGRTTGLEGMVVEEYPEIEIEYTATPGCVGEAMLEITTISGGTDGSQNLSDYHITWLDNSSTSAIRTGLFEGHYDLEVQHKVTGCSKIFTDLLADTYPEVQISFDINDPCFLTTEMQNHLFKDPFISYPADQRVFRNGSILTTTNFEDGIGFPGEAYQVGDPDLLSFQWRWASTNNDIPNGNESNLTNTAAGLFPAMGNRFSFILEVTDQYGCSYTFDGSSVNQVEVKIGTTERECNLSVRCKTGVTVPPFTNQSVLDVTDERKRCCFFESCFSWECRCEYPTVSIPGIYEASGFVEHLNYKGTFPEDPFTFEPQITLLPNCMEEVSCPPEFPGPCSVIIASSDAQPREECHFIVTNISPNPFDLTNSDHEDLVIEVDVPEGGGDLVVIITRNDAPVDPPQQPTATKSGMLPEGLGVIVFDDINTIVNEGEYTITVTFAARVVASFPWLVIDPVDCADDIEDTDGDDTVQDSNCEFWIASHPVPNPFFGGSQSVDIESTASGEATIRIKTNSGVLLAEANFQISNGLVTYENPGNVYDLLSQPVGAIIVEIEFLGFIQTFPCLNLQLVSNADPTIKASSNLTTGNPITKRQDFINNSLISIAPNPFSDHISISFAGRQDELATITIIDITGRRSIVQQCYFNNGLPYIIDLSELPTGPYLLQVSNEHSVSTKKIVKVH